LLDTPEGRNLRASILPLAGPALDRVSSVPTASSPGQPTNVQFDDTSPEADAKTARKATADTVLEQPLPLTAAKPREAAAITALGETAPSVQAAEAPRRRRSIWIAVAGFAVVSAAAAVVYVRDGAAPIPSPSSTPEPSATLQVAPSEVPSAAPSVTPAPSAAPSPTDGKITLQVQSEPSGATLFMNGAQVCDSTPCEVLVKVDQVVELRAELDGQKAERKVLAQRDQVVSLELKKKAAPVAPRKMCTAEVMRDGIKVFIDVPCQR
jgi:hypothetical protein